MSVITEAYAVPGRLIGIYRYLLRSRGQSESRESLMKLLAPEMLIKDEDSGIEGDGRNMVRKTINECVRMGLLIEEGPEVRINPALPEAARNASIADSVMPVTLTDLFFSADLDANHDLGGAIAWYLAQDACDAPSTNEQIYDALNRQSFLEPLNLNNERIDMIKHWIPFLGFGWSHLKGSLTPDPTAHLRLRLTQILPGKPNTRHPFPEVMTRLAQVCPVFEGGFLRALIDKVLPREERRLSSTTALSWLRLRDEGVVDLSQESDALTLLLPDGDRIERYSHVKLLRATNRMTYQPEA